MGKATYDKLDPAIRDVLVKTARDVALWAREQGAADDKRLQDELVQKGMTLNVANRKAFVDASKPIYDKFATEIQGGQAMIDQSLKLAN